jgi:hypothetical protein
MNRIERLQKAVDLGYKYDKDTGKITGLKGFVLNRKDKDGYVKFEIRVANKTFEVKGHQFAWYCEYREIVPIIDHINQIKDDNRIINLRSVTKQENAFNRKDIRGYYFREDCSSYCASIKVDGVSIKLGYFKTPEEARKSYLEAKKIYHKIKE